MEGGSLYYKVSSQFSNYQAQRNRVNSKTGLPPIAPNKINMTPNKTNNNQTKSLSMTNF